MKITGIEYFPVKMKLMNPYTIAYETIEEVINVFIRIDTNVSIYGHGCAAPDLVITGESVDSVQKSLDEIVIGELIGSDPLRMSFILEKLKEKLKNDFSVLAAVDMALYDILGKKANLPIWKILGGHRKKIKTSVTIGIMPIEDTLRLADDFITRGFKCLKLKGGLDVDVDIERLKKVRELVGKNIELRFDANQGYTVEKSIKFVRETKHVGLELLEQPTPKDQLDLLGNVTKNVSIPVMADESLMNLRDAFKLARRDLVDMVNIKLMKVGGISEAMHINSVARSAGLEVMIGCMDESALAITAGLHFALAKPNVVYADLDGHLDLLNDPAQGMLKIHDGYLVPNEQPGLGLSFDLFGN